MTKTLRAAMATRKGKMITSGWPLEVWLEDSGMEVAGLPIGAIKTLIVDERIDLATGRRLSSGLTYWATHTKHGVRSGMAASFPAAHRMAKAALRAADSPRA